MAGIYDKFKADENLETSGIVVDYGDGQKIRIARAGGSNAAFRRSLERHMKPYRRMQENGVLPEETARQILRKVYAEAVVLGWEGMTTLDGAPLEYSVENVIQLFTDLPDLFLDVQQMAQRLVNFKNEALETEAKN